MLLTTIDSGFKPSRNSRKTTQSPKFQDVLRYGLNKEPDNDPMSDYIPDELDNNDENIDPILYEKASQNTRNSNNYHIYVNKEIIPTQIQKKNQNEIKSKTNFTEKKILKQNTNNQNIITGRLDSNVSSITNTSKKAKTFENAYNEVAKKILDQQIGPSESNLFKIEDLLLGPTQIQELEEKSQKAERVKIDNFCKKLEEQASQTQESRKNLAEEIFSHEMRECTFHPAVVNNPEDRRNIHEFLEGQRNFQDKVETKKQIIKLNQEKRLQEEHQIKPIINQNSKKIASQKNCITNMTVHERLYNFKQQTNSRIEDSNLLGPMTSVDKDQDNTFTPIIQTKSKNLIRQDRVETILYNDALRRNEKSKSSQFLKHTPKKSVVNMNSEKLIIQKFIKEFENSITCLIKQSSDQKLIEDKLESSNPEVLLDYISCGEILKNLDFISSKENLESVNFNKERTLLYDLWTILRGDNYQGVSKRNLCMFLLSVQGLYWNIDNPNNQENNSYQVNNFDETKKNLGVFNEKGEWEINEFESKLIHKEYDLFYRNRLTSETLRKTKFTYENKFTPEISETSKVLAEHYRERLLEEFAHLINTQTLDIKIPENGALTHTDLLVLQKKTQLLQHEKKNKEKAIEETQNYSFKPKTNNFKGKKQEEVQNERTQANFRGDSTGKPRYLELYSLAKPRKQKIDRDPTEIEYEKNCDECTFMPDLKSTKNRNNGGNKDYFARNIDKTVERMRNARKDREYVKLWTERGIPKTGDMNKNSSRSKIMSSSRITYHPENQIENEMIHNENQINHEDNKRFVLNHEDDGIESIEKGSVELNEIDNSLENKIPLLYVDVNLGANRTERIVVYEGDESEELAEKFVQEHGLDSNMKFKLKDLLDAQIAGVLTRIEEERASLNSDSEINHQIK